METPRSATAHIDGASVEDAVRQAVRTLGELEPGEMVVHFDLVVCTRRIDSTGTERIERRHWSTPGADPHLSYGLLHAEAGALLRQLTV